MKIFKVSCRSECGTYFTTYLQDVTVMAISAEEAVILVEQWCERNQRFVRSKEHWKVHELKIDRFNVIDFTIDSDY